VAAVAGVVVRVKYSEDQPRDDHGRWSDEAGSSVYYEVAPDPDNAALTARWDTLSASQKTEASANVAEQIAPQVLQAAGLTGVEHPQWGGFEGKTNPSFAIDVDIASDADAARLVPAANLLGYVLSQNSMMVVSARPFQGAERVGITTVHLPKNSTFTDISRTYDKLWELEEKGQKIVGGHSTSNGHMVILNYSGLSDEAFATRIDVHLGGKHEVSVRQAYAAFPQKADYGKDLPTGYSIPTGPSTGQGGADRLRGEATRLLEHELALLGKGAARGLRVKYSEDQPRDGDGRWTDSGGGSTATADRPEDGADRDGIPSYGTPSPGAVSVVGVHYGRTQRDVLNGAMHGQGLRGAERTRLSDPAADPRIKERIYFYVDEGHGVTPESGVGGYRHTVRLNNLYDPTTDRAAIWRRGGGDHNRSEAAILDAGFDGYYVRDFANRAGVAVLLGPHSVPVRRKALELKYSEDQPREANGQWTDAGGTIDSGQQPSKINPKISQAQFDAFIALADAQRGEPESAMERAQQRLGKEPYYQSANALGDSLEHVGDLTHRMSEETALWPGRNGDAHYGIEYVGAKVAKGLRLLRNPTDLERMAKIPDFPELKAYSAAHAKLPVYNRAQYSAREAAVYLGEKNFPVARMHLDNLQGLIDKGSYESVAGRYDPNYDDPRHAVKKEWDESQHPRVPGGSGDPSGEFTSADGGEGDTTVDHLQPSGGRDIHNISNLTYDKDRKTWLRADGKPVPQEIADRLKAAGTPPGWTSVELNPDPTAAVQVWGRDSKDRPQTRRLKETTEAAQAENFARLREFDTAQTAMREKVEATYSNKALPEKVRDSAAVISLIDQTSIRIGSTKETGAEKQAYGATTLLGGHASFGPRGLVELDFPGKSGHINKASFTDAKLSAYMQSKGAALNERIFNVDGNRVRIDMKRFSGDDFSPKDFRTWTGTSTALDAVARMPVPRTDAEYHRQRMDVGRIVAAKLNNTPAMALKAYIDPAVFDVWGAPPPSKAKKELAP